MVKRLQILGVAIWMTFSLGLMVYVSRDPTTVKYVQRVIPPDGLDLSDIDELNGRVYRRQRNKLSALLNSAKHQLALLSCELIDLKIKHNQTTSLVSVTGGWCKEDSKSDGGRHVIDKGLANALIPLYRDFSVASFGDGPGDYKKYMDASHALKLYHAYDGAPYSEENSDGAVEFMDLTAPQYGLPVYDWVMSLEVAEHISHKYEDIYIGNIVRHARVGVVLSWAVPHQTGFYKVNNRPIKYVQKLLSSKGFIVDHDASSKLQSKAELGWLKRNVFVYRRTGNPPNINDA